MEEFSVVFTSMVLEALPFILIGVLVSAFIQMYLSEEHIRRVLPQNKVIGGIIAAFIGVFFPICECTSVPITKGLIRKGIPINMAITYMLAAPIVSPIVIMSTYYAFNGNIKVVAFRTFLGALAAFIIGYLISIMNSENVNSILREGIDKNRELCDCGCGYLKNSRGLKPLLYHASKEFYNVTIYFIFGASIATVSNLIISKNEFLGMHFSTPVAIIIMMLFAFFVSLCSEADAFVASTFLSTMPLGAVMSFLILGPMIDVKNTFMLLSYFKKGFVFKLVFLIFAVSFIICALVI
ncbi:permease [Inconstantimicrobium mannanitabidum]|uniref:Uncharacterized protein n=1 Tax=Inconstantimicrobium mannanitabidum TaxID=1604901 RepID=A0ACB5RGZ2_9CLOT|nr:permease [Clostridium sp. TW13]GKX68369.1 hypothetical protein rsdtw13_36270 [Clostridium sp. TW13]